MGYGDGWTGNVLTFIQNGSAVANFTLKSGKIAGPFSYTFKKFFNVSIIVSALGSYSYEVGYVLKNAAGNVITQRFPGYVLSLGATLGRFCPECVLASTWEQEHILANAEEPVRKY